MMALMARRRVGSWPKECRREDTNALRDASGVRLHVTGAEGTHFAEAGDAFVGRHFDHRGREVADGMSSRPRVLRILEPVTDLVDGDGGNFHQTDYRSGFKVQRSRFWVLGSKGSHYYCGPSVEP